MIKLLPPALVLALAVVPALGCASSSSAISSAQTAAPQQCTMMDCSNQLAVSVRTHDGRPPKEGVQIDLDVDGKIVSCRPTWKGEGEGGVHECGGEVALTHQEIRDCKTTSSPHGTTSECKGTGKFEHLLEIRSNPKRVKVTVKQGDRSLGERVVEPTYQEVTPNGPGCQPVCKQAQETWELG